MHSANIYWIVHAVSSHLFKYSSQWVIINVALVKYKKTMSFIKDDSYVDR